MKKLYSIGEVSSLLGISTQTLRYYDKIGVAQPAYVNEKTGYRRYTYDQIHYIDRIRYLQNFGLSLSEIRSALESGSTEDLVRYLAKRKKAIEDEMQALENKKEDISWYIDYYTHLGRNSFPDIPFKVKEEKRYVLAAPFQENEPLYGTAGYRLTQERFKEENAGFAFLRQNGYILDFKSLMDCKIKPSHYFIYLKEKPEFEHKFITELPAGEYLCFRGKILAENYNVEYIKEFFEDNAKNHFVVANEYEDNFKEFRQCIYEIQILI